MNPTVPQPQIDQVEKLRAAGIPEELISQLLGLGADDPSGLARQYDQSAFLRRGALSRDAKGPAGVAAQVLMGLGAKKADTGYANALRSYRDKSVAARKKWFDAKYGTGQITETPQAYDYSFDGLE